MPGKFTGKTNEQYWNVALDGADEEIGSVQTCHAWEALIVDCDGLPHAHAIIAEDSRGFVDIETFDSRRQAMRAWWERKLVHEQPGYCCNEDDDEA